MDLIINQGLISPTARVDYFIMVCPYSLVQVDASGHVSEVLSADRSNITTQGCSHKASKARHSAESGSMPHMCRPVRRSLSFKECFTILAGTFIVATATSVVVLTAAALPEMKEIYKLEMKRMDR